MGNGDVSQTQAGFNWSLHDPKSGHPDGIQQLTRREWMRRAAFLSDETLLGHRDPVCSGLVPGGHLRDFNDMN